MDTYKNHVIFGRTILSDFKISTPRLNLISIFMNLSALYSFIIVVHLLKISLSSDRFNVLKTSSIEDGVIYLLKHLVLAAFSVVFILSKLTK